MQNKKIIEKINSFPEYLKTRIIGQDSVIEKLCEKISYAERGITNPRRPKGCFFFLGPTGTGKTEIVLETIKYFYGEAQNILRLNMSEFNSRSGTDIGKKLIGYSRESPGLLYPFLTNTIHGAILYDEFEKADPEISKYMLQQLDAAQITLWDGKTYNLQNYYLFFTSNVASAIMNKQHLTERQKMDTAVNQLRRQFSPEFVARFGAYGYGILTFNTLYPKHLRLIAAKFIKDELLRFKYLREKQNIPNLIIHGVSVQFIENALLQSHTTQNGAREIRDIVERMIYRAYTNAFTSDDEQNDKTGYLDINCAYAVFSKTRPSNTIDI